MLVHQQLVRSSDRRRLDALPDRRTDSLHNASQRRRFLLLCVVFVGPFLSSFLDAAFVVWNNWGKDTYWELIRIRLFSNALAAVIVVPLVVTWVTTGIQSLRTSRLSRYLEASALFVGLLLVSYAVLYKFGSGADSALLFLPLPFLFGRRYDSALWEKALLFRSSVSWQFGAQPTSMGRSPADHLNKTLFRSKYF